MASKYTLTFSFFFFFFTLVFSLRCSKWQFLRRCSRWRRACLTHHRLLHLKKKPRNDDETRCHFLHLRSHWLRHTLCISCVHLLGFYDLNNYISWVLWSCWDFIDCITPYASLMWCRWLHHTLCISSVMLLITSHLMHLLTFCDLIGLHHHLMYLPVRGDVNTP